MAKSTDEQIERSLRKLARAMAEWNYPREQRNEAILSCLLFRASWNLLKRTGHVGEYDKRMKVLRRVLK